jgi:hypothetical protein
MHGRAYTVQDCEGRFEQEWRTGLTPSRRSAKGAATQLSVASITPTVVVAALIIFPFYLAGLRRHDDAEHLRDAAERAPVHNLLLGQKGVPHVLPVSMSGARHGGASDLLAGRHRKAPRQCASRNTLRDELPVANIVGTVYTASLDILAPSRDRARDPPALDYPA